MHYKTLKKVLFKKIYLTASGGPFLDKSIKRLKKVNIKQVINHPNWKMGKKYQQTLQL